MSLLSSGAFLAALELRASRAIRESFLYLSLNRTVFPTRASYALCMIALGLEENALVLLRIAECVDGIFSPLHLLNVVHQKLAIEDDACVGQSQPLLIALCNRALCHPHKQVLTWRGVQHLPLRH